MSAYGALSSRIKTGLQELQPVVMRVQLLTQKALANNDDGYWDGVALNLHSFYTGLERIFEDIARSVEGSLPQGRNWHADLLRQMTSEIADLRPTVIRPAARACLEEYRGFRHIVCNVYALNLRPARVRELADMLPECFASLEADLTTFIAFLEHVG
jgi:hypothetical protein